MQITIGPVQYWWPRPALLAFYADLVDGPAHTVVLGEAVCSRRNDMKLDDWLDLARDLKSAGKQVRLVTQTLVASEAELRTVRRVCEQGEFAVEAGDASALGVVLRQDAAVRHRLTLGPHLNIYSRRSLEEHASLGATHWAAAAELSLTQIAAINPPANPVLGPHGPIATEVWAFGRLPLAFSARCFTARHHRLTKDACDFRCRDDADGLLLTTEDGEPFLTLNGIQTQSAKLHCLIAHRDALLQAGVVALRLSPCGLGFERVVSLFHAVMQQGQSAASALDELQRLPLPGELADGYALGQSGMTWSLHA